jgi:RNA polymerase sigma-70 factor (ECF subfamily)
LQQDEILEELVGMYWKPVYCYLRCKGYDRDDAKDLTQGFFHEIVLRRGLIQQADQRKGRFRMFLLTALSRYVTSAHRAEAAKQRMPEGGLIYLGEIDALSVPEPVHYRSPVEAFDYAWGSALVDRVLGDVARRCREKGDATDWELFRARVLLPIMDNANVPSLARLCMKYGISRKAQASNMIFTVKRRFQRALRRHVRQFVSSDAEVDSEILDLMTILSRGSARPLSQPTI